MELALTFGAVGDILAISLLIKDIISSLDNGRGSSKRYQDLVQKLSILDDALREVDKVICDSQRVSANRHLCSTALKIVQQIQSLLQGFNSKLEKFRSSLSPGGSGTRLKDAARKVQFKLDEKDIDKVKGEVMAYIVELKMILETMTLRTVEQNHEVVTKQLATMQSQTQETRRELEVTGQSLQAYVRRLGRQIMTRIAFLTHTTIDIKRSVSQIASTVLSMSTEVASFRSLLMTMNRTPVDEFFTFEDALGRVFPIHLRTISSWDAFAFVLSEKFRGERGARRVRCKRYKLLNRATRREINQGRNWERTFLPHQMIVMSILCKDDEASTSNARRLANCPWCKTQSKDDPSSQVQCQNGNMFYTRIVELDDAVLPPRPSKMREAPQFGQPSFNVELPRDWKRNHGSKRPLGIDILVDDDSHSRVRGAKLLKYDVSRKRRLPDDNDSDYESDDNDVSGFVRVTVVSRQKRIKLFHCPVTGQRSSLTTTAFGIASSKAATAGKSTRANFLAMLRQSEKDAEKNDQGPVHISNDQLRPMSPSSSSSSSDTDEVINVLPEVEKIGLGATISEHALPTTTSQHLPAIQSTETTEYISESGIVSAGGAFNKFEASGIFFRGAPIDLQYQAAPVALKATDADARKHHIPAGYSLKHWDPTWEPILLVGSVFDANSLGKWIYDWTFYYEGPTTPISILAGEMWLLLIQLAGKVRQAEEAVSCIQSADDRDLVEEFIEAGRRLYEKLRSLLKACEAPMVQAAKQANQRKNAGVEFVKTIFGRELDKTEKFMANVRLFNLRFDANCQELLQNL